MKILDEQSPENILNFIKRTLQFRIPDFQRSYAWTEEQVESFLESIKDTAARKKSHFLGSIVYFPDDEHLSVIDGQQRLTTVILFLIAVMHELNLHPEKSRKYTAENIQYDYLYDSGFAENKIILRSQTIDLPTFQRILKNNITPLDEQKPMTVAYRQFQEFLGQEKTIEKYIDALEKFEIITVELDSADDNPQIIFENINSTGKPLTSGDKIRNYALMLNNESARNYVYQNYWMDIEKKLTDARGRSSEGLADFFRCLIIAETEKIHYDSQTYFEFKKYYNALVPNHRISELDSFYSKANSQLENYLYLTDISSGNSKFSFLNEYNFRLYSRKIEQRIPFLMCVLERYKNREIAQKDAIMVFDYLERYITRSTIAGTGGMNTDSVRWDKRIVSDYPNIPYGEGFIQMLSKVGSVVRGVPTDNDLDYAVKTRNFSSSDAKYILAVICDRNYHKNNEETSPEILRKMDTGLLPISLEHIMPQKLSDEWKYNLGKDWDIIHQIYKNKLANLTLTGYNSKYSNRTFDEKCHMPDGFTDSPLFVNKKVAEYEKWDKAEMDDRTKWLQDIIKKTWAWPTMRSLEEKTEERQTVINGVFDISDSQTYSLNITGAKPEAIIINEGEIMVRTWKEAAMRFFEAVSRLYPNFMETFSNNPEVLNSKLHPAISENELKLRVPEKIRNSEYYLETNASAMTLIKWIRKTCDYIKKNANNIGLTVKIKV